MPNNNTILIVDDIDVNRATLYEMFHSQYEIAEAENGLEAVSYVEEHAEEIAVILLDLIMPISDGFEVLSYLTSHGYMPGIPVILITSDATKESEALGYSYGVSDIIYKPFITRVVIRRVINIIELYQHKNHMEQILAERTGQLRETSEFMIDALSTVVEFRNVESGEHIKRIKLFTRILLQYAQKYDRTLELTDKDIDMISRASALHDIGKIGIPDSILLKPARLTKKEFSIMETHTTLGCDILTNFHKISDRKFFDCCYDICRHHHERWDGGGYPDHLAGQQISPACQLVSIVDVYDALVSKRIYKEAFPHETAIKMITDGECGEFSPLALKCFHIAEDEFCRTAKVLIMS